MKCLTHDLQRRRGLPAAREIITILEDLRGGRTAPSQALARLANLKGFGGTYVHLCLAVRAANRLIVEMNSGGARFGSIPNMLARGFCEELLRSQLEKGAPQLMGRRFQDQEELYAFIEQSVAAVRSDVEQVADSLSLDPTAGRLKPPSVQHRVRKSRTVDLLDESLV
ncbi:MAG TPA: hypothetical protein VF746_29515 [Longimicrobium sp.]|jgi:hypothetical protein